MTASALDKLITLANLRLTWKAFWRASSKQRSSGVDGVTPATFNVNLERNLVRLQQQLRAGYDFSPLRGHPVPKKDGSLRIICVPTVQDRIVQRLLAGFLTEKADRLGIINDVSFGFIPSGDGRKRGVQAARDRAIALRCESGWAYKSDISSFFDRIPRQELIDRTVGLLKASSLRPLLMGAAGCEIEDVPHINRIADANGIKRGLGVRQGMPLSPLFANVILRDFDREMTKRGKKLVRYADDFIILAGSEAECIELDALSRRILSKRGFDLPPLGDERSKTYIAAPDQEIDFLGLALSPDAHGAYHLILTEKQLERVKRALNQLSDVDQLLKQGIDISGLAQTIENRIGGYLAAYRDAQNISDLEAVLDQSRSGILRGVYVKAFGEDRVRALSKEMRKFLCLDLT